MTTITIHTIRPYWYEPTCCWVFDDSLHGLVAEPFVRGASEVITAMVNHSNLLDPARSRVEGFRLRFSSARFDGAQHVLFHVRAEDDGHVYRSSYGDGWLCPALFKYFETAPPYLFLALLPLEN
jgi:hypothetical protein